MGDKHTRKKGRELMLWVRLLEPQVEAETPLRIFCGYATSLVDAIC